MNTDGVSLHLPGRLLRRMQAELDRWRWSAADEIDTDNAIALADLVGDVLSLALAAQQAQAMGSAGDNMAFTITIPWLPLARGYRGFLVLGVGVRPLRLRLRRVSQRMVPKPAGSPAMACGMVKRQ